MCLLGHTDSLRKEGDGAVNLLGIVAAQAILCGEPEPMSPTIRTRLGLSGSAAITGNDGHERELSTDMLHTYFLFATGLRWSIQEDALSSLRHCRRQLPVDPWALYRCS